MIYGLGSIQRLLCADYAVESLDAGRIEKLAGRRLTDEGLRIDIVDRPGSALIRYRRTQ
jgi:hypothetical protein